LTALSPYLSFDNRISTAALSLHQPLKHVVFLVKIVTNMFMISQKANVAFWLN